MVNENFSTASLITNKFNLKSSIQHFPRLSLQFIPMYTISMLWACFNFTCRMLLRNVLPSFLMICFPTPKNQRKHQLSGKYLIDSSTIELPSFLGSFHLKVENRRTWVLNSLVISGDAVSPGSLGGTRPQVLQALFRTVISSKGAPSFREASMASRAATFPRLSCACSEVSMLSFSHWMTILVYKFRRRRFRI